MAKVAFCIISTMLLMGDVKSYSLACRERTEVTVLWPHGSGFLWKCQTAFTDCTGSNCEGETVSVEAWKTADVQHEAVNEKE